MARFVVAAVGKRLHKATGGKWAWTADELSLVHGSHDEYFFLIRTRQVE